MDFHNQATFIPKRSVTSLDSGRRGIGFFSLIALIIFISTVIAAGGMYVWRVSLDKALASKRDDLAKQEAKINPGLIASIVRLNNRIISAKEILEKHVAVSSIFEALQKRTVQTVQFQSFDFSSTPIAGKESIKVSLKGVARDYSALAAQSQEIVKGGNISNVLFSNFTLNEENRVNFLLDATIDPALINYGARVSGSISDVNANQANSENATSTATSTAKAPNPPRP